ncbi:MAG: cytochrome c oxidase accessory protein CcoG, partial [Burkholderiales bacterium]|nr:cytochrome c oxidase accessory protein CcoG [Burkholderiales bacterium]
GGMIENVYRLQIMNATEAEQQYGIAVSGLPGLVVASEPQVSVESTQSRWVAVRLQLPYEAAAPGTHPIHFEITAHDAQLSEKSVFLVPR